MNGITPVLYESNIILSVIAGIAFLICVVAIWSGTTWLNEKWNFRGSEVVIGTLLIVAYLVCVVGIATAGSNVLMHGSVNQIASLNKAEEHYGVAFSPDAKVPDTRKDYSFRVVDAIDTKDDTRYSEAHLVWKDETLTLWVQDKETAPEYAPLEPLSDR